MTNNEKFKNELNRIEEDSICSAKGHFYAAQRWVSVNFKLGCTSSIFAAVAGASALSQFDYHNIIAGGLSIIVISLTAVMTFINPREKAFMHKKAGNQYKCLQDDVRIFHNLELNKADITKNLNELKKFNNRKQKLNDESYQIPRWAFKKAQKGIEEGESSYKIDN